MSIVVSDKDDEEAINTPDGNIIENSNNLKQNLIERSIDPQIQIQRKFYLHFLTILLIQYICILFILFSCYLNILSPNI